MKIRIKFTKEPSVKFLGHLDILRFFQKCFVRAQVKMLYSEGFNPHQKLSFALPLGVGALSRAEYVDADIEEGQDLEKIKERMNMASGAGFEILDVRQVKENAGSLMSAVAFASYEVSRPGAGFRVPEELLGRDEILVTKKGKKGDRQVNIRPLIVSTENSGSCIMKLHAGSENNLNPELLLKAVCDYNGEEYKREDFEIVRTGLFAKDFIPLEDYETCVTNSEN